jgi:hypothetical protein
MTDIMECRATYIVREYTCEVCGLCYWQREPNDCDHTSPRQTGPREFSECEKCGARLDPPLGSVGEQEATP